MRETRVPMPSFKLQRISKHQTINGADSRLFDYWSFSRAWILELGAFASMRSTDLQFANGRETRNEKGDGQTRLRMDRGGGGMVGTVGRVGGAMVRQHFAEDPRGVIGKNDP